MNSNNFWKLIVLIFAIFLLLVGVENLYARSDNPPNIIYDYMLKKYVVEVEKEEPMEEVVSNPYQTIPISDTEYEELRWVIALESGANNFTDKKAVCETILNRVLSEKNWGGSVSGVIHMKHQFSTVKYIGSPKAWATPGEMEDDVISEVLRDGCKVLPSYRYVYFDSKGGVNGKDHIKIKGGNTYGRE